MSLKSFMRASGGTSVEVIAIVIYLIIGIVTAGLMRRCGWLDDDDVFTWLIVMAYPLFGACFVAMWLAYQVNEVIEIIGGKK